MPLVYCWLLIIRGIPANRTRHVEENMEDAVPFYLSALGQISAPANLENGHFWTLAGRPDARISKGSRMAQSNCAAVEKHTGKRPPKTAESISIFSQLRNLGLSSGAEKVLLSEINFVF